MVKYLRIFGVLVTALTFTAAAGQGRVPQAKTSGGKAPSAPQQAYAVYTGQDIAGIVKELQSGNIVRNLMEGEGIGCRVFLQHEKDVSAAQAEVHENADDVFIVMEGEATYILGGKLESPKEVQPGEWRASGISGGREFVARKGDILTVPRGTPHRRTTPGQEVTVLIFKATGSLAR